MNIWRLRWLAIVVPLVALAGLDAARHSIFYPGLHDFPGVLGFFLVIGVGVSAFSFAIFGVIQRLERRVLEQNARLSALNDIAAASAENLELHELLSVALDKVLGVMNADAGVICLLDTQHEELVAACYRGLSEELAKLIKRKKLADDPMAAEAVRTGRPVVADRLLRVLEDPQVVEACRREGFQSAVSVPLRSEGEVNGILGVVSTRPREFSTAEVELLSAIGAQLGLAVRNATLFEKGQQRNQELAALLAVGRAAASYLDLQAMLEHSLDTIVKVTSAEAAEVWLTTGNRELTLERHRGAAPERFLSLTRLQFGEGLPGLAAQSRSPLITHELASDSRAVRRQLREAGFQTYCALPLLRGVEVVGILGIAAGDREALSSAAEARLLEGIGEQMAIAIESARLHERVLDVAVLEERERISRELHDGLSQVLGYVNTQALAIRKLLSSDRIEEAQSAVITIEEVARELYADVREAVLGLRVPLNGGLLSGFNEYFERYRELSGVTVELKVNGSATTLRLPQATELHLMRIVQEALSNVRKHAGTTHARVSFVTDSETATLEIADEGCGFNPAWTGRRGQPRFGLETMRERVEAVGGEFEMISAPGGGTRAIVRIPINQPMEKPYESVAG